MFEINWQEVWIKVIPAVFYPSLTIIICKILFGVVKRIANEYEKKNGHAIYVQILVNLIKTALWLICAISVISQFDGFSSTLSALLASSGILALGISMAAQESLSNLIDGIFLSVYHPFNIGDRISLPEKGITGTITSMNLRHTIITTFHNTNYIVSNSTLSSAIIENSSMTSSYSYPIDISITYDSDIDLAVSIIQKVISSHPEFVDKRTEEQKQQGVPAVNVMFRNFGASGIELRASMVTNDVFKSFKACSDVRFLIKKEFDAQGVNFPFTTITIDNLHKEIK